MTHSVPEGGFTLDCGGSEDPEMRARFIPAFRIAFGLTTQVFFNPTDEDLGAPGCKFATISVGGRVIAGARGVLDGGGNVYVCQCFTVPEYRKRGLIGVAVAALRLQFHDESPPDDRITDARLVVRRMDGRDNERVQHAYENVGFRAGRELAVAIDYTDRASQHLDEHDGVLRTREMTADETSLELCREIVRRFRERFS